MKRTLVIIFCGIISIAATAQDYTGKYIDPALPDTIPRLFAPGMISTRYHEHSAPNFSPNGKEMIFTLSCEHGHTIMYTNQEDSIWTAPSPISFSGKYSDDGHIWLDNNTIIYNSKRPERIGNEKSETYRVFKVERSNGVWGVPQIVYDLPRTWIETKNKTRYLYLPSPGNSSDWNICASYLVDGSYNLPTPLGPEINTDKVDAPMYIPPDESYIIFASMGHSGLIGIMDLYISFRQKDGSWSQAVNMGPSINRQSCVTRFPRVSRDGKYLFFYRNNYNNDDGELSPQEKNIQFLDPYKPENGKDGDIYWVSTKILENFK